MKLATRDNQTKDGELMVVSTHLEYAVTARDIAPNLQYALDHWSACEPRLKERYDKLCFDELKQPEPFNSLKLRSPLPRAYQWADGSAYVNHVELVRKARGAEMPDSFWTNPLMYQGGSDDFLGPHDDIPLVNENWGLDFESEIAIITSGVPLGVQPENAEKHIVLCMLVNDISLRNLIPDELAKGFGFFQSKPSSSFSPVAITPDELGKAWHDGKLHLPLRSILNGKLFGTPDAGVDMTFAFPQLISHAAKTRNLGAGTIIGSGTVSNYDRSKGSSCIAEKRMLEKINTGKITTPFLKAGDTIKIEMQNLHNDSLFGAIEQKVIQWKP